ALSLSKRLRPYTPTDAPPKHLESTEPIRAHLPASCCQVNAHDVIIRSIFEGIDKEAKEEEDEDLQKPYKEVLKSSFTRRIIEFSAPKHRMPTNLKIYDGSTDPDNHVPKMETEMMKRGDEFINSEEVYRSCQEANYLKEDKEHHTIEVGRLGLHMREATNGQITIITSITVEITTISDDVSDESLIIEAKVEDYLVRRVFVEQGAAVQVMFEHCFNNLPSSVKARLVPTLTELVGFFEEHLIRIGKIELEVAFESEGLCRRTMMKFTVVRASSSYNIILGCTGMRELRPLSSTIHAMMKFPTPRGIATLVSSNKPAKNNMDVFAWQPYDMTGVPKRIIRHTLNFNMFVPLVAQKRRVLGTEKIRAVIKEVEEWIKADIMRPVWYPTWISNPVLVKKTKAVPDMKSPTTLKEMQSVRGKLVALNRFLSRSLERSLPFFETLKNITKENKEDYRWMKDIEHAFQEMKKLIIELSTLTTPLPKEELYVYLATSQDAVSGVLLAEHNEKQTPVHYVNRTLHEAERNYAPLEKLALLELRAYNITYVPRNAIKGQVLADFINETPVDAKHLEICSLTSEEANLEEWTLYTDGESSLRRFGAGLVLIDPTGVEYTYAICLNFPSTNNETGYEELLAGLRIAQKIKVQVLKVNVDSKMEVNTIAEEEEDNWKNPFIKCLEEEFWTDDKNEARNLRMKVIQYVMEEGVLFKKSYLAPMLRCVGPLHANYVIREVNEGACEMHSGPRSVGAKITRHGVCEKLKIKQMNTAVAHPQANGLMERANKLLMLGLKERLGWERVGWVGELPNILQAHQTMLKTSNGKTPFSLTYESEVVILAEIGMPTYRTILYNQTRNKEEIRLNLDLIQERREMAAIREAKYKKKVKQYYNKRVRLVSFRVGTSSTRGIKPAE
nr:hypothetical protein [Tanacetum cinerariifolium]